MLRLKIVNALLKKELLEKRRTLLWFGGASVIVLFFVFVGRLVTGQAGEGSQGFVMFWFSAIGFFLATESFAELKRPQTAQQYLLLPASHEEKTAAKAVAYTLGWFVVFLLCWLVAAVLATFVVMIFRGAVSPGLVVTQITGILSYFAQVWHVLLFMQSLAMFAAVYFRRLALLKLIIVCGIAGFIFTMLAAVEGFILYHNWAGVNIELAPYARGWLDGVAGNMVDGGLQMLSWLLHIISIPFLWFMTWLRLRETEAV